MNAEREWHVEALRLRRERYGPGTRALFALLDGTCAPRTVTRYYAIGEGLLGVTLDSGDTWLIAASRAYVLTEEANALVDGGGSKPMSAEATPADVARIRDLIDRSSLGTPGARHLQQRTSDEELKHIRSLAERERGSTP